MPLTYVCQWSQKHKRPLLPLEMLAVMGMPTTEETAGYCGRECKPADVSMLSSAAQVGGSYAV